MGYKLNLGAGRGWKKEGWISIDHAINKRTPCWRIPLPDHSCDIVFTSHMVEHISHYRIEQTIIEINRVLRIGGRIRLLTPDLFKLARAYVDNDRGFFKRALIEDDSIRGDLGLGGAFINFIVSPGKDSYLFNNNLTECIGGYAHVYSYDFEMMQNVLSRYGFSGIAKSDFLQSAVEELREPLHYSNQEARWRQLDEDYSRQQVAQGAYTTGFDRDPDTSLFVEALKAQDSADKVTEVNSWKSNQYGLTFDWETYVKIKLIGVVSGLVHFGLGPARFVKRGLAHTISRRG